MKRTTSTAPETKTPASAPKTEPKTNRGTRSGTRPGTNVGVSQHHNSALLHEEDLKAISAQVLSAVMEKIIPLLEKIEHINKSTDHQVMNMSAEQTAAKQLQQQLQTMAQMKLKSLEDRVTHRIQQMRGK